MSKHTLGPWIVGTPGFSDSFTVEVASTRDIVAIVYSAQAMELGANQRLIAAAPEMLEALKACAEGFDSPDASSAIGGIAMNMALAAIANAEGSP